MNFDECCKTIDEHLNKSHQIWLLGAGISKDAGIPLMFPLTDEVEARLKEDHKTWFKAVLGSTGSGKSGTVAAVVHGILNQRINNAPDKTLRPRIVLIDPHGEYAKAFDSRCVVYQAYNRLSGDKGEAPRLLRLPYWLMTSEEFRDLVVGQANIKRRLRRTISSIRH